LLSSLLVSLFGAFSFFFVFVNCFIFVVLCLCLMSYFVITWIFYVVTVLFYSFLTFYKFDLFNFLVNNIFIFSILTILLILIPGVYCLSRTYVIEVPNKISILVCVNKPIILCAIVLPIHFLNVNPLPILFTMLFHGVLNINEQIVQIVNTLSIIYLIHVLTISLILKYLARKYFISNKFLILLLMPYPLNALTRPVKNNPVMSVSSILFCISGLINLFL